jgi:hypothetical protein
MKIAPNRPLSTLPAPADVARKRRFEDGENYRMHRKLALMLTVVLLAAVVGGCSRITVAYNSASFFIERYADDYLALDGAQMAQWSPTLKSALARHREEELPYLAAFFDSAGKDAAAGFTPADARCLLDRFEVIYRRHFVLAADAAGPLLAGLDDRQIDELAAKFAEEAEEDRVDESPAAVAKRERKRGERYADNLEWWVGDLTSKQRGILLDVARRMPDTAKDWYAYRDNKRRELIRLLRGGASAEGVEAFLRDWLVDYNDLPADLQGARSGLRRHMTDLLVRIDATLSDAQRRHFVDRLHGLRDDFMTLQQAPRMATLTGC